MKHQMLKGWQRKLLMYLMDMCLILAAYFLAMLQRLDFNIEALRFMYLDLWVQNLPWMLALFTISFWLGGLYDVIWKYAGVRDMVRLTVLTAVPTVLIAVIDYVTHHGYAVLHRSALLVGGILIICFVGGARFVSRLALLFRQANENTQNNSSPLMIVGAGSAASWAVNLCKAKTNFGNPVIMVDDDPNKKNMRVQGVPVRGTLDDIPELARRYHIREIVIAIPSLKGERLNQVVDLCHSTHCRVRMLSDPQAMEEKGEQTAFRELNISDFLSRDEIQLDTAQISGYLEDKVVLVTGGGGSIGSELCRQIAGYRPARLVLLDIAENTTYELQNDLLHRYGHDFPLSIEIASVRDRERLDQIFEKYRPQVVFHAAAHKHVPLMEACPCEAVKNNVLGTYNTASAASRCGAEKFVLISTDKAVNPTNVMGATKYLCEQVLQGLRHGSKTEFAAVRFGNVLGSSGSVIPLFKKQIAYGGPVTITDRRIVRYFMTIAEAVQLVLEAGSFARSGEVFVLDMGQPVYIRELAEKMICLSGLTPGVDIEIQEIGLRPGEKLYEELLISDKNLHRTENAKIFVEQRPEVGRNSMKEKLDRLRAAAESNDAERMVALLHEICPTFRTPEEVNREAEAAMQGAGV